MTTYIEFHLTLFLGAHDFRGLVGKVDRLKLRVIEKNSLYLIHGAYLGLEYKTNNPPFLLNIRAFTP